jgi:hypothetical protein
MFMGGRFVVDASGRARASIAALSRLGGQSLLDLQRAGLVLLAETGILVG